MHTIESIVAAAQTGVIRGHTGTFKGINVVVGAAYITCVIVKDVPCEVHWFANGCQRDESFVRNILETRWRQGYGPAAVQLR